MSLIKTTLATLAIIGVATSTLSAQQGNDDRTDEAIKRSAKRAQDQQQYLLRYRLKEGEVIRWNVEQVATTNMSMAGYDEESSLRSRSVISWTILSVDDNGNMTLQDKLESAIEWQQIGNQKPVSYDSTRDERVPEIYQNTAEKIGKPIATTTIKPNGVVIRREEHVTTAEFGMGRLTMPLPAEAVAIGSQWHTPEELVARRADGTLKTIKTRMLYTLRKIEGGIATIAFRREILTPIDDPKVKSQIQQKLNHGALFFDMQKGRITRKVVQWDEKVQGFEGDDSYLHYVGNYTMTLIEPESTASSHEPINPLKPMDAKTGERSSNYIRPRNGKPVIRK